MPEPFKNMINAEVIRDLGERLRTTGDIDVERFVEDACEGLSELELKARVARVAEMLRRHLDPDYERALNHILRTLPEPLTSDRQVTSGMVMWPLCHFVETYGLGHFDLSIGAMHAMTRRFSCEFAIRPYLLEDEDRVFKTLHRWVEDPDEHVRRLVSEGTRPRLPWGIRLTPFVEEPGPVLELLDRLKDDRSEYVRRSVANNLNDVAKDHPERVVELAGRWLTNASPERERLVRHALRTLFKQGHEGALTLFGFGPPNVEADLQLAVARVRVGESLPMSLRLVGGEEQRLMIDYAVFHRRANGTQSPKVFKWTTRDVAPGQEVHLRKSHSFKPVTTRKYYPGAHRIELRINGKAMGTNEFELLSSK